MSYREGLPRNIMELMSAKKTVIGTNIRGIKDLIEDEKTGYLVEVGDYKTTANKIEKLYNNKKIGTILLEAGGCLVREFLKAGLVDEWVGFYAPIIIGGGTDGVAPGPFL